MATNSWVDTFTSAASGISQAVGSIANVYTNYLQVSAGTALERAKIDAQIADAKAKIAAANGGGGVVVTGGSNGGGTNWLMIGGFALLGGLLVWKLAK